MAADITTILSAMRAVLVAAYPTIDVLVKAKPADGHGKAPAPGWAPMDPCPCHVLSELDAEAVDTSGTFELLTLTYPVVLEAVFTAAPQPWDDDPAVRTRRIELMNLFFRLPSGFPGNVFDPRMVMLPVYAGNAEETVLISAIKFNYTLDLARP